MGVINAVAEFERDLLIERTQVGLARARAEGKAIGRPASLTPERRREAERLLRDGRGASAIARELKVSRATIRRVHEALHSRAAQEPSG